MNFRKALTFMFEDESWLSKSLLGVVVMMVPVLNLAWIGYCLDVVRNTCHGVQTLPTWDDIGDKWLDGLKYLLARWIYTLPVAFIIIFPVIFTLFPIIASQKNERLAAVLWVVMALVTLVTIAIVFLYSLALSWFSPAFVINYSRKNNFGAFFECGTFFSMMKSQFSMYLTAWIAAFALSILASLAAGLFSAFLSLIPCLGYFASVAVSLAATVWASLVSYHLYGQVGVGLQDRLAIKS